MVLLGEFGAEVDELFGGLLLVVLEGQCDSVGGPGVGTVDGLAPMAEVSHGFPLGHSRGLSTLGPGIAVGVEDDPFGEFGGCPSAAEVAAAIALSQGHEMWEELALGGEFLEQGFQGCADHQAGIPLPS